MDTKSLQNLDFPKVLERLAAYCSFPVSSEKARQLKPSGDVELVRQWQSQTSEAVRLLTNHPNLSIGAVHDVRAYLELAKRDGVLTPIELLEVKSTLLAARSLGRFFSRLGDIYPHLTQVAGRIPAISGLAEAITYAISERGEIQDSASDKLASIRHDLRLTHERLLNRMQRIISDPQNAAYLQEALITQREGRYVLPLKAEFKGRIQSIVHDQSASGATLFVEPLAVVELNNRYRELQLAERDEERRILLQLSGMVAEQAAEIQSAIEVIAELDLVFARARYAIDLVAAEPILHSFPAPRPGHPGSVLRLYGARHPLLDPNTVVPIDLELDAHTYALVITGPNTGGKTVTLKTVGILALMAQSGLHIPARTGSELSVFSAIYADIGDEQSIEQSLSTFSGHITNIIRILKQADTHSLVILDELGAGTDPQEGAALARALLSTLLKRGITTLVTTHHPELKAYAHATPGAMNACMEFDLETLRPTYRLVIGLPGRSNAIAIAQRLGMPEEIIQAARAELDPSELRSEDLLDEIYRQRDLARQARAEAEKALREAEALRTELSRRLEKIEEERRAVLEEAQREAQSQLDELKEEVRRIRRELARARQPVEAVESIQAQLQDLERELPKPLEPVFEQPDLLSKEGGLRPGDRVYLPSLKTQGIVKDIDGDEVEVQLGALRLRTRLADVQPHPSQGSPLEPSAVPLKKRKTPVEDIDTTPERSSLELHPSPGMELDLRGQRADEALEALEDYLDAAYLAGLPWVRIIHGKGSGKLRQAVRDALSRHSLVSSFEAGGEKEGGEGVTIVKLRTT